MPSFMSWFSIRNCPVRSDTLEQGRSASAPRVSYNRSFTYPSMMSSSTHTVFRLAHRNGFDGIQPFTEPIPVPSASEVLLKVRAVSLNYRDILIARSQYPFPMQDNLVPCSDMAGEVVQAGSLVERVEVGDKVILPLSLELLYGHVKDMKSTLGGPKDGVLREYIAVPEHVVVKIPKGAGQSWEQWASLITTGSTVWNAFYGGKPLMPGMSVLAQGMLLPL